jgi:hypothetical protein
MRINTPSTSVERELEERSRLLVARHHGREPERLPASPEDPYAPLDLSGGPLPPQHPLADSSGEARYKRLQAEKRRRGLL